MVKRKGKGRGGIKMITILTLSNGKQVYLDGDSISTEEAHEIIINLIKTWGTDFEKRELKDRVLEM